MSASPLQVLGYLGPVKRRGRDGYGSTVHWRNQVFISEGSEAWGEPLEPRYYGLQFLHLPKVTERTLRKLQRRTLVRGTAAEPGPNDIQLIGRVSAETVNTCPFEKKLMPEWGTRQH